jgi:hypothetical protein
MDRRIGAIFDPGGANREFFPIISGFFLAAFVNHSTSVRDAEALWINLTAP